MFALGINLLTTGRTVDILECPCCGSIDFRRTGPLAPGFSVMAGHQKFSQGDYVVNECCRCWILFKTPTLERNELQRYYSLADYRKWETAALFPTERAVLKRLRQLVPGSCILDFGCSSGRLLAALGAEYRRFGIEINESAAAEAEAKGLRLLRGSETDAPLYFDAITLIDVFEHLSEPLLLMQQLSSWLKPGGLLIIVTGNGDHAACRLDPGQFWYFRNVEHLCMLTERTSLFLANQIDALLRVTEEHSHYDTPFAIRSRQRLQNFAFWEFRKQTRLARFVLRLIPYVRRARLWKVAPGFACERDHLLVVFEKNGFSPES